MIFLILSHFLNFDYLLIFDATDSTLKRVAPTNLGVGGSGSPGGSADQLQYNNGGSFGGATKLLYDDSNHRLGVGSTTDPANVLSVYGDISSDYIAVIDNDQSSAGHGLKVSSDGTGTGTYILDLESGDGNVLRVRGDGSIGVGTTTIGQKLTVEGDIGIASNLVHKGDSDTLLSFADNQIQLKAGNLSFIKLEKKGSAPHEITLNNGSNNIDFIVKGNGNNEGNPGMKFDGSNNRLGINGVGTPSYELDVDGNIGLAEYIYHRGDDNTYIQFGDDQIILHAGGRSMLKLEEGVTDKLIVNHGGLDIDFQVKGENDANLIRTDAEFDSVYFGVISGSGADNNFFVSGSISSRGTATRGTTVFGGDVVISGSLYTKQRHVNTAKFSSTNTSQRYVRWDAAGSNGSPGVNNKFIAPASGRLISVMIRCTSAADGTNIAFHREGDGTANLNTTAVETIGIDISSANTVYQATFSGVSDFGPGDIVGISVNPSSRPNDVNMTCVWEFNFIT